MLVAVGLAQALRKVLSETGGFGSRYAGLILAIVVAAGLVAYSRQRAAGPRWVWRIVLSGMVLMEVVLLGFTVRLALGQVWTLAGWLLGAAVLLAPGLVWLWDYVLRSRHLWGEGSNG